jgi:hypothetical protein
MCTGKMIQTILIKFMNKMRIFNGVSTINTELFYIKYNKSNNPFVVVVVVMGCKHT